MNNYDNDEPVNDVYEFEQLFTSSTADNLQKFTINDSAGNFI